MPSVNIDFWESAELAAAILDVDPPEDDEGVEKIEDNFLNRYGTDLETLAKIAEKLVPMCACDKSPLTGVFRRGFVRDGSYVVKEIIKES